MVERRILIRALNVQDGLLAHKVLVSAGIECALCPTRDELLEQLEQGAGALLIVEELIADAGSGLRRYLQQQPRWSDLPVLVLTKHGSDSLEAQRALEHLGNVTLLERPVRTIALISAAKSALRGRDRQYQVRLADRRKDEFLATLAHELRNPLAPISNAASIVQRLGPSPDVLKLIGMVERQVGHLTRLVDDLLDMARITNGKLVLQKRATTIRSVVTHAVEIANAAIAEKGHRLTIEQPRSEYELDADHVRVVQSLANLLVNAAKFTPPAGRISLRVAVEAGQVRFRVRDNGAGLERESLSRIFEMFAQARTMGQPSTGLGIGLNLAKRFAELHGGTVTAASDGLGHGSEFVLSLPLAPDAQAESVEQRPAHAPESALRKKVLVVDDNLDAADTLCALLTLQGLSAVVAYDGAAAVTAVRDHKPDAIVMDIGMPVVDGYEAARLIRSEPANRGITMIALTGWGQHTDRSLSEQAGFDFHLVKPVDLGALMGCLARVKARWNERLADATVDSCP
jgi:signal transduction histidine kinase/ActR/RegA family two-component response regulator